MQLTNIVQCWALATDLEANGYRKRIFGIILISIFPTLLHFHKSLSLSLARTKPKPRPRPRTWPSLPRPRPRTNIPGLLSYHSVWYRVCVVACSPGYFRCVAGGTCLPFYIRCNGRCDCPYCTDELHCYTPPSFPNITTTDQPSTTTMYLPYNITLPTPFGRFTTTYQPLLNYSKIRLWRSSVNLCRYANRTQRS